MASQLCIFSDKYSMSGLVVLVANQHPGIVGVTATDLRGQIWRGHIVAQAHSKQSTQQTEPATSLERLHADRAGLAGELDILHRSAARLRDAASGEAAVLREIVEMGTTELAAMTAWATAGAAGEPPTPDLKQRRAVAERLVAAQAAAAAANGAGEDIAHQVQEMTQRIKIVTERIDAAVLDSVADEFLDLCQQNSVAVEQLRLVSLRIFGLCSYLSTEGRRRNDGADTAGGKQYLARAEQLANAANKLPKPGVSHVEIAGAADTWGRHVANLRRGPLS